MGLLYNNPPAFKTIAPIRIFFLRRYYYTINIVMCIRIGCTFPYSFVSLMCTLVGCTFIYVSVPHLCSLVGCTYIYSSGSLPCTCVGSTSLYVWPWCMLSSTPTSASKIIHVYNHALLGYLVYLTLIRYQCSRLRAVCFLHNRRYG